jgi:hypothetical protein
MPAAAGGRLGVMQPYFLPYTEHFRLIAACDAWLVFDTVKYQRRSWMNRNRVINRDTGWTYMQMPVSKRARGDSVAQTRIQPPDRWVPELFDKLQVYAGEAPAYAETTAWLRGALAGLPDTLAAANTHLLRAVCRHLEIATPIRRVSELDLDLPAQAAPGEWALHIARACGAAEYRNPAGGRELFDPALYARHGIRLSFHAHRDLTYPTGRFDFVPGLSVVDALMWLGRARVRDLVQDRG